MNRCFKGKTFLKSKFKNTKLSNIRVPHQGYRYAKESRLQGRGNSFCGYGKIDLKEKIGGKNRNIKCSVISDVEYVTLRFLKKWIPKMRLCPYREQLIRGSDAGVKDSCNAVTRGCSKKHVCTSYCENTKGKRKRDIVISSKKAVNLDKYTT
jgi:hypothetical protein